jgi:phage/plasmid-associated DNA primase
MSEYAEETTSGSISSRLLYGWYKKWATENGYHPLSERMFGKEVKRKFPKSEKRRTGSRNVRQFEYFGIQFSQEEICGEKIEETRLF